MSAKFNFSDLFDFKDLEINLTNVSNGLAAIDDQLKDLAKFSKISLVGDVDDLKDNNEEVEKLINLNNIKIKADKLNISLQKEQEKLVQAQIKTKKDRITLEQKSQKQRKETIKETKNLIQLLNTEAKTEGELLAKNKALRLAKKNVNFETKTGVKQISLINKSLDKNNAIIKKNSDALSKQKINIGNYKQDIKEALNGTNMFGGAFGMVQRGLASAGKAMKIFGTSAKMAIAGTGIGLLVIAFGALYTFLTKSNRGMKIFQQISAALGAILGKVTDIIANLGEALFNAFQDPKQAIIDLFDFIKNNAIKRFEALINIGRKLINLEFDGLTDDFIQLSTGIEDSTEKMKDFVDEIKEAASDAALLEARLQNLRTAQRKLDVDKAKSAGIVAELVLLSQDESVSVQNRIEALQKAAKIEEDQIKRQVKIYQSKYETIKAQNALSDSSEEDLDKEAQAQIEVFNLTKTLADKKRMLLRRENTLRDELAAKQKAIEKEREKENLKSIDVEAVNLKRSSDKQDDFANKEFAKLEKRQKERQKIRDLEIDRQNSDASKIFKIWSENTDLTGEELENLEAQFVDSFKSIFNDVSQIFADINQAQINSLNQQLEAINESVTAQEERVNKEQELAEAGKANFLKEEEDKLNALRAAEDEKKKQIEEAEERDRKFAAVQIAISQAVTAAKLIEAAANAIAEASVIPIVGVALGLAAAASIVAGFIAVKNTINGLHDGIDFVDGPAGHDNAGVFKLERGERVVNAEDNKKIPKNIKNSDIPDLLNTALSLETMKSPTELLTIIQEKQPDRKEEIEYLKKLYQSQQNREELLTVNGKLLEVSYRNGRIYKKKTINV